MVSDAQKQASAKWDKENMVVLACKAGKDVERCQTTPNR